MCTSSSDRQFPVAKPRLPCTEANVPLRSIANDGKRGGVAQWRTNGGVVYGQRRVGEDCERLAVAVGKRPEAGPVTN